ncbi:glutathione S-transferase 1-like [Homarus americanus]|nr:glutathione S-transferase 1-like [Homarus americanus]
MTLDFYYMAPSAPCRSVMLTAKAVGVELNLKELDLMAGEQMKPEFIAINPQHCVPTLVDDDFALWESRPICSYLVNQYGEDDSLYPSDPKTRAQVDRLLYFDMGTLYHRFGEYVYPVVFRGQEEPNPQKLESLQEALGWLNDFLDGHEWAVGDTTTIADHVLVASVSTLEAAGIDITGHANIVEWLERCKSTMPGYEEVNEPGAVSFGEMVKAKFSTD